jgi:cell division protein ZapA
MAETHDMNDEAKKSDFNIKLNIAGKVYPLTIVRENEELFRRAEREINDLASKLRTKYRAEREDYLAMAAFYIALDKVKMEMSRSLGEDIDKLVELEKRLDKWLESR